MRHPSVTENCVVCGAVFHPLPYKVREGRGRFCSRPCSDKGRMGTAEARFWSNVTKGDGCWTYRSIGLRGYGKLRANGRDMRAHRYAWELTQGPIPHGLLVCHHCDNPSCVRPDHLFLGTNADNAADRNAKGRTARGKRSAPYVPARGEQVSTAVLKASAVRRIRKLYASGGYSQQKIADRFGVHQAHVSRIILGKVWSHLN